MDTDDGENAACDAADATLSATKPLVVAEEETVKNCKIPGGPTEGNISDPYDKINYLEKTIRDLNIDFGQKRAAFKEMYLKREEELQKEREAKEVLAQEIRQLQDELNEAKSQVTIAELTKENEVGIEKNKYHHDLQSLRIKFEDKIVKMRKSYEEEIQQLKALNQKYENQAGSGEHFMSPVSSDGPGSMISAVTKSLARKLNSTVSASNDSLQDIDDSLNKVKPSKYAQEDAEILRSLVIQLEEEVAALKEKLRSSDEQLAALQGAQASLVKGNSALADLLKGDNVQDILSHFDDKLREAQSGLEAEKSSRADLEMYVAFANAQKTHLQDELDKSKTQLKELKQLYEAERRKHEELKETWEKANDHFVTTHNEYITKINQYREVLTPEQLEQLENTPNVPASESEKKDDTNKTSIIVNCPECEKSATVIEKLKVDLYKATKLRDQMEEEWGRVSHDYQTRMSTLEEQVGTYDVVLLELNTSCQQSLEDMEATVKRLNFDRDSVQRKIERLEDENEKLKGRSVAHSELLENEYISIPNDTLELQEMVLRLKEQLISVKVGKEQIEGELKFAKDQTQMIEEEKARTEESLNAEIKTLREQLVDLNARLVKAEEEKRKIEKTANDLKAHIHKSSSLKNENEKIAKENETLQVEVKELNAKVMTLRRELTNSEDLQRDLINLSKSLQVNLESIRQAETEVRWQHPDDVSHCNSCRKPLGDAKEKINCKHCGRIFCPSCVNHVVKRGNRDYHVCGICHTLLVRDSAPYFSTVPPHSPD